MTSRLSDLQAFSTGPVTFSYNYLAIALSEMPTTKSFKSDNRY